MVSRRAGVWSLVVSLAVLGACAVGSPVGSECKTGMDCESGACNDGVCVEASGGGDQGGGPETGGGDEGGDAPHGGGPEGGGGEGGGSGGGICSPDHDGQVTREEVPLAAGLEAQFLVATDVTLSSAGEMVDGVQTWDLSGALSGDHTTLLETLSLSGTWYEDSFPGATYASRLSDTQDLLGVFEITDEALLLVGVVSPNDDIYKTELTYDPPVRILSFPLEEGKSWSTDSTVSGTAEGVLVYYYESYDNVVDARGDTITPFATFDSLRIAVDLTRTVGALITTQRTFAFVTECFGTIATMNSQTNESGDEFSDQAELRRITP